MVSVSRSFIKASVYLPLLLVTSLIAAGCGPSKYASKADSWIGLYGYEDLPIDSTTYQVNYAGDNTQPAPLVERYALYRCAELTSEKGFDYFVIIDKDGSTSSVTTSLPGEMDESHHIEHQVDPQTGKSVPVSVSTSTYTPGMTTTTHYHIATKTIRLFKGARPQDNPNAYDAKSMLTVMGPTIKRSNDGGDSGGSR